MHHGHTLRTLTGQDHTLGATLTPTALWWAIPLHQQFLYREHACLTAADMQPGLSQMWA